jgi:hypothetical protein
MGVNAGYIRAARIYIPNAVEKIALDRFLWQYSDKWMTEYR